MASSCCHASRRRKCSTSVAVGGRDAQLLAAGHQLDLAAVGGVGRERLGEHVLERLLGDALLVDGAQRLERLHGHGVDGAQVAQVGALADQELVQDRREVDVEVVVRVERDADQPADELEHVELQRAVGRRARQPRLAALADAVLAVGRLHEELQRAHRLQLAAQLVELLAEQAADVLAALADEEHALRKTLRGAVASCRYVWPNSVRRADCTSVPLR
jgi:hypothetical protein